MPKTCVITGATGFVGRHLVAAVLADTDWDVVAVSRRPAGPLGPRLRPVACDLTGPADHLPAADYAVHLAGRADVAGSVADPVGHFQAGAVTTVRVLEWAKARGVRKVVAVGTDAVFGPFGAPNGTASPWSPATPYGAAKCAAAAAVRAWHTAYGLPALTLCPMNVFGEGQPQGRLIPTAARALRAGKPLGTFGGRQNWLYAGDLAGAILAALRAGVGDGRAYPVTSDDDLTAAEVVGRVADVLGIPAPTPAPAPDGEAYPGQAADRRMDGSEFRRATGWEPRYGFDQGLRRTLDALRGA